MQKSPVTCENRWRGFVVSVAVGGKGAVLGGPLRRMRSEVSAGPSAGPAAGSPTTTRSPGREHMELLHSGKVREDRKSTRLNSSHVSISYAVFCLKKKKKNTRTEATEII